MQNFPCPNPTCRYVFDASMLPPAAMVTCPLCGTRFPYRAGHPVVAPAAPTASVPVQRPTPPPREEEESSFGGMSAAREAPVVRRRVQPKGGGMPTWLVVALFCGFLLATVFVISNMMRNRGIHNREVERVKETKQTIDDLNLVVDLKDKSWKQSDSWRTKLGATVVYQKDESEIYFGVYAEDFKDRNPRPVEIRKLMEKRLKQAFDPEKLETQDREGEIKWLGKSAQAVTFQGAPHESETIYKGECDLMVNKGIAYLFFAFCPLEEYADQQATLGEMRKTFSLGSLRDNWKEKVSSIASFASKDGFQLQDRDGVWIDRGVDEEGNPISKKGSQFAVDPKDLDPKAKMALIAEMERKKTMEARLSFTPTCEAMILLLEKSGDPLESVKKYVLNRYQAEAERNKVEGVDVPQMKLEVLLKSPSETELPKDGTPVARWVCTDSNDAAHQKLVVLSAIEIDDKLVGFFGECSMKNAMYMEPYLLRLASTLAKK